MKISGLILCFTLLIACTEQVLRASSNSTEELYRIFRTIYNPEQANRMAKSTEVPFFPMEDAGLLWPLLDNWFANY